MNSYYLNISFFVDIIPSLIFCVSGALFLFWIGFYYLNRNSIFLRTNGGNKKELAEGVIAAACIYVFLCVILILMWFKGRQKRNFSKMEIA